MIKKITDKDKKDWLKFIKSNEKLENKDSFYQKQSSTMIEKSIDLHGCSLDEANKTIYNFIMSCYEKNVSKIKVITGKGSRSKNKENPYQSKNLSILKHSVPDYINSNPELATLVSSISNLSEKKGGEGVILVKLRKL